MNDETSTTTNEQAEKPRRTRARRATSAPATPASAPAVKAETSAPADAAAPAPAKTPRRRATKAAAAPTTADAAAQDAQAAEVPAKKAPARRTKAAATEDTAAKAPAKRTTARKSAASKAATPETDDVTPAPGRVDEAPTAPETTAAPKARRSTRGRSTGVKAADTEATTRAADAVAAATADTVLDVAVPEAAEETVEAAPARKPRTRRAASRPAAAPAPAAAPSAPAAVAGLEELERAIAAPHTEPAVTEDDVAPQRPARRGRRSSAPARSPEQRLDVLAELGSTRPEDQVSPEDEDEISPEDVATASTAAETDGAEEEAGPRLPATALLFQAPDASRARPRRRRAPAEAAAPEPEVVEAEELTEDAEPEEGTEAEESTGGRRRRRRGGRGRRNRSSQESDETVEDEETADEEAPEADEPADVDETDETDEGDETSGSSSRRRRRRRRSGGSRGSDAEPAARPARDEVTALKGSTRLEAKRQRRREGREAGRRRPTITESEFLARREAVARTMVVREKDGLNQIAVLEDGILVEHYVARHTQTSMVGNVYLGRVQNVLPSMEAAFVDLGKGRNAVLYAGEVNWDAAGMDGQPRRIEQALKSGDAVLVQVTKDPIGHKGARLTAQITLAGRHLVLVPSGAMTGISRKLPENERARLKKLLKEIVPAGSGVIVRTAAEGATEEQLRADVERLTKQWADIEAKAKNAKNAPVLLKGEPELAVRVVRDVFNEDFDSLVVSGSTAWETISTYVKDLSPDLADRMHHWVAPKDVFAEHRVDEQLAKAMDRKVWLPSGGSLVIDRTEAMTVVDVNTGKFTGSGGTLEETVTRNNIEAAEEIVRQLRLRDIGGIIVIDFIDMVLESNRDLVMRRLVECLGRDRTRHQVAEVTSLGLVQMTRKRVGQGLVEAFSSPCEHCNGRGFIVHDQPVERSGESHPHVEESGSATRRRGRRGGGEQAPEPVSEPVSEDPEAVAAREAVKATLATIAAAAASAHHEEGADGAMAPDEQPAAVRPAEQPSVTGAAGADATSTGPEPTATGPTVTEPARARRSSRRRATAPASAPAPASATPAVTGAVTGVIGAQAGTAVEPAGAAPSTPAAQAAPAAETATATDAAPSAPVGEAPVGEAPQAVAPQRARRSRRAVSSGVVTPGETKIVTAPPAE